MRSSKIVTRSVEATAYSSDWRSCGWEWGLALGPFPAYLPLCAGRRPSGTVAWPLVPQVRRERDPPPKADLLLGGLVLGTAFAAGVIAQASSSGKLRRGVSALFRSRRLRERVVGAACAGAVAGGTAFPIGRYWAETNLKGLRYAGTTATGAIPRQARPAITRTNPFDDPVSFLARLCTFRWGPVLGSVAADTSCYPLGTRVHVEGWGWGVVEDRGGAIRGDDRVDVYMHSRRRALEFGRKRVTLTVRAA